MVPDTSAPCAPVEGEPWLGVVQVGERPLLETQITGLREDSPFEVVAEKEVVFVQGFSKGWFTVRQGLFFVAFCRVLSDKSV